MVRNAGSSADAISICDRVRVLDGIARAGDTGTVVDLVGRVAVVLRDGVAALRDAELVIGVDQLERLVAEPPNPLHQSAGDDRRPLWWRRR